MQRFNGVLTTAAVVCTLGVLGSPSAVAQSAQYQSVRNVRGSITGVVSDDHGGPIAGAMVSALGTVTVAKAVTDASGWFSIDALPIGDYTLKPTGPGSSVPHVRRFAERPFARAATSPTPSAWIARPRPRWQRRARPVPRARSWLPDSDCQPGRVQPEAPRRRPDSTVAATITPQRDRLAPSAHQAQHPEGRGDRHRRRTGRRGISSASLFEQAMDSAASLATTFFTDLPFSGEVNLLTTSAFGPGELFSAICCRAGSPTWRSARQPRGRCGRVRAAMNQGDLSSWIVAGAFVPRRRHTPTDSATRSARRIISAGIPLRSQPPPTAAEMSVSCSHSIGGRFRRWWPSSSALATSRYDYLRPGGLFSPRVGVTVSR